MQWYVGDWLVTASRMRCIQNASRITCFSGFWQNPLKHVNIYAPTEHCEQQHNAYIATRCRPTHGRRKMNILYATKGVVTNFA